MMLPAWGFLAMKSTISRRSSSDQIAAAREGNGSTSTTVIGIIAIDDAR
jgi:hypothetical protein